MEASNDRRTLDDVDLPDGAGGVRDQLRDWMTARPFEVVGASVVLAGAVIATVVVFWSTSQRPTELPPAAGIGAAVHPHDLQPPDVDVDGSPGGSTGWEADTPHGAGNGSAGHAMTGPDGVGQVIIHVSGGVHRAGVVTLPTGSRVADAVIAAGGATDDADLDLLNLARLLNDAEQVHVPRVGEEPAAHGAGGAAGPAGDGRVDINRASAAELESLPGIGPARARAIVTYREEHGPFGVPGDLRAVSGIGEATFQNLADRIRVG